MKFTDIGEDLSVFPGEYVLHKPTSTIVLVGAFNRSKDMVRVLRNGKLFEDKIHNFQKIELNKAEHKEYKRSSCKKCKGSRR
tara:strand:+ start:131 stop:376 length:246 start_codon:yes stop_codon:yes gene_type:complete